jgi:effector-binding domain-containing protein
MGATLCVAGRSAYASHNLATSVCSMTNIRITEHPEQATAAVREQVPMAELTEFFARAFQDTMTALQDQGVHPTGAPFGKYYGRPGTMVDVEAGFPVATTITPAGRVLSGSLPGGRVVEAMHIGPYDTMESTYAAVERYFADAKLSPGAVMWESYLTDPGAEPDPAKWQTQICWPID